MGRVIKSLIKKYMSHIKTCSNGHNYDATKNVNCPYCPQSQGGNKTIASSNSGSEATKTVIKSSVFDSSKKTVIVDSNKGSGNNTIFQQRTKIMSTESPIVEERKIVGFLVTYDMNQQGKAFILFEGKNIIGSNSDSDILIPNDPGVSGKHLTILYRNNSFIFRDELSNNGTFIDGEMINEGILDKQCIIRVGNVSFFFIMVPFNLNK